MRSFYTVQQVKVYEGISGGLKKTDKINSKLKELFPEKSLEKWDVSNCAECDALNKALNDGAKVSDLEMHTLKIEKKTDSYTDFERCKTVR